MNTEVIVFEQDNKQVIQEGSKFFTRVFQDGENFESGDFNTLERAKESLGIAPTIAENNRLIAEFMGYQKAETLYLIKIKSLQLGYCHSSKMIFHSDWNWLMEVVEKIESLDYRFAITEFLSEVSNEKLSIKSWKEKTKFENTYNACVEFIKWYNQQK